jgi:serine/threonine protein kinase
MIQTTLHAIFRICQVLEALAIKSHPSIVHCLYAWNFDCRAYMLFPLAGGDLYHFLRTATHPPLTGKFTSWLVHQLRGISDTIRYLHDYELPLISTEDEAPKQRRIGFHHDLKPANILLFDDGDPNSATWKITDFSSRMVVCVGSNSSDSIYNIKPSPGDPIYSAPDFVSEGRVSLILRISGVSGAF